MFKIDQSNLRSRSKRKNFFKELIRKLNDIGFYQSDADPCLMIWKSDLGIVFVAIYVDDC